MAKKRTLADLLVKLSLDPALRRRFREAPPALKDEAELSEEDLDLVAGGNPDQLRASLGDDATVRQASGAGAPPGKGERGFTPA